MIFTHSFRLAAACLVCTSGIFLTATAARGNEGFSSAISKADYDAAGLKKLSAKERANLDALIKAYAAGQYAATSTATPTAPVVTVAPTPETAVSAPVVSTPTVPATPANPAAPEPKPKKQKVKIDPGTEIEYNTMDSELVGTFAGFEKGTVFTLANGQRWKVIDGSYVCGPDDRVKKVRVKPGVLGSFFLEFEKIGTRAKVQLVK